MKSFKKIALGMVAAMTLGTIVATPASAAPMTVAVTTWNGAAYSVPATAGTTSATAIARPVPSDNSVDAADVVKFVATVDTGTTVQVSAANAAIVLATASLAVPVTASSGTSAVNIAVGTGTTAEFYVYTKTTAIGAVSVTNGGTTTTYYIQGTTGKINSLVISGSDSVASGTAVSLTVTATDVFGNKVPGKFITAIANGATLVATSVTTGGTLADYGTAELKFVAPVSGPVTVVAYLTFPADLESEVAGFNKPSASSVKVVSIRDLAAELKASQDALAAEKASHEATKADLVKVKTDLLSANIAKTNAENALAAALADNAKIKADNEAALTALKKAFNALATKWNAKNPKAKIALLK
jgi:hypothetical protein